MSRTVEGWSQWFLGECLRAAQTAVFLRSRVEPNRTLYLFGKLGALRVAEDPPPSASNDLLPYELVTPEPVPLGPLAEIEKWVRVHAARFPCLPVDMPHER